MDIPVALQISAPSKMAYARLYPPPSRLKTLADFCQLPLDTFRVTEVSAICRQTIVSKYVN